MTDIYPLTLVVLGLALTAVAVDNWRTGLIRDAASLAVLAGGVASCAVRVQLSGDPAGELFVLTWLAGAAALIALSFFGLARGVAKLFIAILPWLHPQDFLLLITLWGFGHFAFAQALRRSDDLPAVPALAVSTLAIAAILA